MPEGVPGASQLAAVAMSGGISVEGDSIFDNIFDWIGSAINSITSPISDAVVKIINAVGSNIALAISATGAALTPIVQTIADTAVRISSDVTNIGVTMASNFAAIIVTGIPSIINSVTGGIAQMVNSVGGVLYSLTTGISNIIAQMGASAQTVIGQIGQTYNLIVQSVTSGISSVLASISQAYASIGQTIVSTFAAISAQVEANMTWFADFLDTQIPALMKAGIDGIMGAFLDFTTWVPKLFDAISTWMSRDIPGHSPWWESILENIVNWSIGFLATIVGGILDFVIKLLMPSVMAILRPIGELFNTIVTDFIDVLQQFTDPLGPMAPEHGLANFKSLSGVGLVVMAGLAGMTALGQWLKPLGDAGLGHIAAMIYDMTNYKLITGAFVGALVVAAIKAPVTYYYNDKFRPTIPSVMETMHLYGSRNIDLATFKQLLSYHGYADSWQDSMADNAYRTLSVYQLTTLAQSGAFDKDIMQKELEEGEYRPEIIPFVLDGLDKTAKGNLKAVMVASATGRYKAGLTTADQLTSELKLLNLGDNLIPLYVAGADLDYSTAYTTDMITAYTDGVRSGRMSLDEFRQALLALGLVPDRVEAKVLIENLRIKPASAPTTVTSATPVYLTEAGKLQLDTIRRQRKLGTIDNPTEQSSLIDLGMTAALAAAYADNDDTLIAEASVPAASALVPKYETVGGKVSVDTIRRSRRSGAIDHPTEVAQLTALAMPDELAEEYASNDDLRVSKSATTATGA